MVEGTPMGRVVKPATKARRDPQRGPSMRDGVLWMAASATLFVAVWWLVVLIVQPEDYILPSPAATIDRLWEARDLLIAQGSPTVQVTLIGFVIGAAIAVPLGVLIVAFKWLDRLLYPMLVASNAIPKVALAPLFVVWFGYGSSPRVFITVSMVFFPIVVNTIAGLHSADPDMIRLAKSMGAPRRRIFLRVRLPAALPTIFAGLKLGTSLAVIGAIIGEFIAADTGWGYELIQAQGNLDTSLIFAIILLLAVFATLLFYLVGIIERLLIPWHSSFRN